MCVISGRFHQRTTSTSIRTARPSAPSLLSTLGPAQVAHMEHVPVLLGHALDPHQTVRTAIALQSLWDRSLRAKQKPSTAINQPARIVFGTLPALAALICRVNRTRNMPVLQRAPLRCVDAHHLSHLKTLLGATKIDPGCTVHARRAFLIFQFMLT